MTRMITTAFVVAGTIASIAASGALASSSGATAQGARYVSGGVASEERAELDAQRGNYNLHVVTVAERSGAYLAGVDVTITDGSGNVVMTANLDGPWLLVALEPGRYTIDARFEGQRMQRSVALDTVGQREVLARFAADADIPPRPPA